ncbi:MAG TPA: cell division protein FtsK [Pseudonocardia sp.]|jgi:S-DNA-T family DNA segregation ATPase FtsK/SpoIIIE
MTSSIEQQPIVAGWLRSRDEFIDTLHKVLRRWARNTAHHTIRSPLYALKFASWSPRGFFRTARAISRLVFDHESKELRLHHADQRETAEYIKLRRMRDEKVRNRLIMFWTLFALLVVAGLIAWWRLPEWSLYSIVAATVLAFGYVGRRLDKPIVKAPGLVDGAPPPLRAPFVMSALCSLGIDGMKNPDDIGLLFDVARVGPGYQCDLELPRGVDATAVIERRPKLSAALRRELGTVWPSVGKRHQGHLVLYVADQAMATGRQATWPLLKAGKVDVFAPAPFATDQRGSWIDLTLAYTSGVIGAVPRMGKTFYLRQLLLMAGLDARCQVYAVDLKGTGDLAPTALFAHSYLVGDEDDEIAEQLDVMRALRAEMRRRARVIRALPHDRCPENKVTSLLADDRELGLAPIFLGVDECQVWFQHDNKAIKAEFIAICTDLVKRGPALGIMCYFATQKPDAKSIPSSIADNAVTRIALKLAGQVPNDQVLGTSSYNAGLRASVFSFEDKGIAYLKSDGADARIVRSVAGLDAPTAEKVAGRCRSMRLATGRLTGAAADEDMSREIEQVSLLDDLREVMVGPVAHLVDLVGLLAQHRPDLHGHLDTSALGVMLRSLGIVPATVWDPSKPREKAAAKGIQRGWLDRVSPPATVAPAAGQRHLRSVSS